MTRDVELPSRSGRRAGNEPAPRSGRGRGGAKSSPPAHVLAQPGDARVLCGMKAKDALPLVWAEAVQAHVDGWGMEVCPGCAQKMGPVIARARAIDVPLAGQDVPLAGQATLW